MSRTLPRDILISLVIVLIIVGSGMGIISSFVTKNPSFANHTLIGEFNESFDYAQDINETTGELQQKIESPPDSTFGWLDALFQSGWKSIKLFFQGVGYFGQMIFSMQLFGVPAWILGLGMTIIIIVIVTSIISAIFQRDV